MHFVIGKAWKNQKEDPGIFIAKKIKWGKLFHIFLDGFKLVRSMPSLPW